MTATRQKIDGDGRYLVEFRYVGLEVLLVEVFHEVVDLPEQRRRERDHFERHKRVLDG